ncbi:MAG: hypothetical protein RJA22_1985 [Verrucomicrobiota bacterium]
MSKEKNDPNPKKRKGKGQAGEQTPELPLNSGDTAPAANGDGSGTGPERGGRGKAAQEPSAHITTESDTALAPARVINPTKVELPIHRRVDTGFLQYASYVIRDRAIPNLSDGLKPVQRRILWSLYEKDDGRFIKVATISGHCAQYHPHGEAAIGDALVVLTNKRYLIEGQGNFGNIFTGDPAAAPRYIEARLTELARTEIFNNDLTQFVPSYDGRNREPVTLPSRLPLLLMLGTEGIAVGMACKILPHNFPELLEAQIAILKGTGTVKVRAKLKARDESTVVITQIPPSTTTESLIASIEDATRKGKLKVRSVNDYTSEDVEIEIKAPQGVSAEKLIDALYAFTDCEVTIASRIIVIRDNRPVEMTVSDVLRANTADLVDLLRRELELKQGKLEDELHFRTLERIFIEERIYKKIEQCRSNEAVFAAVHEGFRPFRKELLRELIDADVDRLLQVRIRRISLFDIQKHREDMERTKAELEETRRHLKNVTKYAIGHLEALLAKYGPLYPRLTKSSRYDEVDAKEVAFKAFKVAYDRETGYVGYKVSGDEFKLDCTKFDKLLLVFKDGHYKVTELPEKLFVGPDLYYCGLPDRERVFTCAYTNREATSLKRFTFGGTILNKEYFCIPPKSRILFFEPETPKELYIRYKPAPYQKINQQTCDPKEVEVKGPKTRGRQVSIKEVSSITSSPTRGWDKEAPTTKLQFT